MDDFYVAYSGFDQAYQQKFIICRLHVNPQDNRYTERPEAWLMIIVFHNHLNYLISLRSNAYERAQRLSQILVDGIACSNSLIPALKGKSIVKKNMSVPYQLTTSVIKPGELELWIPTFIHFVSLLISLSEV